MNRKVIYILASTMLLGTIILTGCGAKKEAAEVQKAPPSWYLNPPKSTASTLYAIGEGEDRDEALKNALNMMASTLSVSISSQYDSKKVVQEGLVNTHQSTVVSSTQSDLKKIRISSYELMESHKLGFNNYTVLIRSDKQKLFDSLKHEIEQKFALVDSRIESLTLHNALQRLNGYKKIKDKIKDVPDTIVVMNVLNSSYSGREYLHRMERINSSYEKLLSNISVEIECNGDSKVLEAPIREGFFAKGVEIKNSKGSMHFRVAVDSNVKEASSYGFTLARYAIDISIKDYKGSVVASSKLNIIGSSAQGYDVAKEDAAIKLDEMIKKDGIDKITGLGI